MDAFKQHFKVTMMGLLSRFVPVVLLAIAIANPGVLLAQFVEDDIYYIDSFEIEAEEEQQEKLDSIEKRYFDLLEPLEKQFRKLSQEINELKRRSSDELHASLVPSQIKSINAQRLASTRESVARDASFLADFARFAISVADVEKIELLEGYARKRPADKPVPDSAAIRISGFYFYPEPLKNTGTKLEVLRQAATDYQFFSPTHPGGKFCGGFHPDLALRYMQDGVQHYALICLTCSEMWVTREDVDKVVKFDFTSDARLIFKRVAESCFVNHELAVP